MFRFISDLFKRALLWFQLKFSNLIFPFFMFRMFYLSISYGYLKLQCQLSGYKQNPKSYWSNKPRKVMFQANQFFFWFVIVTNERFVTFNFDLNLVFFMHQSVCIQTHYLKYVYITKNVLFYVIYKLITDSALNWSLEILAKHC